MYLWDIRITSRVPDGADPVAIEDALFDALQDAPGVDLWTGTADPDTGCVEAHFGLLAEDRLRPDEALGLAIRRFIKAAEAAGWIPDGGSAEVIPDEAHFEISFQGIADDVEQPALALA